MSVFYVSGLMGGCARFLCPRHLRCTFVLDKMINMLSCRCCITWVHNIALLNAKCGLISCLCSNPRAN